MTWLILAALVATPRLPHGQRPQAPAPAGPQPQLSAEEVRDRVETYLGSIDVAITAQHWRALGPQAPDVLEPIATDPAEFPTRRARALQGLVVVAPDRAARLVGVLARDEQQPVVVRVAAMRGAGEVLTPAKAISELKPVLHSARSAGLRGAAAEVLSARKGGCEVVKAQAARERAEDREAYRRALSRCE